MVLISVVTVCKEDSVGLLKTTNSYESQLSPDTEQILVVAPSQDGSDTLALQLSNEVTRVFIVPAKGIYNAMNYGLMQAQGRWVLFLNSGDVFVNPESLNRVIAFLNKNVTDQRSVLFSGTLSGPGREERITPKGKITPKRFAYSLLRAIHPSILMRKDLIQELGGFSEEMKIASDYELIIRALSYPTKISEIEVAKFSLGGISTTSVRESLKEARQSRLRALSLTPVGAFLDYFWFAYLLGRHQAKKITKCLKFF